MPLPAEMRHAAPVLLRLQEAGHTAVFVGGCVRDMLLGLPLKDVDIASSASPEEVMELYPNSIPTGLQHGTVTVRHGGELYEVTTFRTEGEYADHRRPSEVSFIRELAGDLQRRDFTINAMALHHDGTLEDPYGGMADLRRGLIRAVGNPEARFGEDALRMLRAVRFAAVYGFRLSHSTWRALLGHRGSLKHVAMERIGLELDRIAEKGSIRSGASWLYASGLLECLKEPLPLPGPAHQHVKPKHGQKEAADSLLGRLAALDKLADGEQRWQGLFIVLGMDKDLAGEWFRRLRYSRARKEKLESVLSIHRRMAGSGDKPAAAEWHAAVLGIGAEAAESWLRLMEAAASAGLGLDFEALPTGCESAAAEIRVWMERMPVRGIGGLAVDGKDIQQVIGTRPGPWMGRLLERLALEAAGGAVPNEQKPLLDRAAELHEQKQGGAPS
ncbi:MULTISPECIES: CCA tRNA nucleotidyltransferase [unclassified Paenibacillus]|uniref:CCA tRNA nucleotidyltransferase n=1 Tax=unclassified Paenibacillus TaxID=185978 RepID=UPI000970918E|nr:MULTISPECIES: CCA tRNA nucleotidyltransferase [unclassified Paenibacillus]ASS65153.2 CCA tRNA nucleotidyltransferase [Paenibacillus sp. RUD330]